MQYKFIDEKFKEKPPIETIKYVKGLVENTIGIKMVEENKDAGVGNCFSVVVSTEVGVPASNGKGITKDLSRASGYAEFIERLQSGISFYKYQSLRHDPKAFLHTFAPDAKYMTAEELIENSPWMDTIIETYGQGLTKEKLAKLCEMYAGSKEILCLPYYSLFEDKYVYLPSDFIDNVYMTNGCCAGNSREEAWTHAFSELLERHYCIDNIRSQETMPEIPEEVLNSFPSVKNILSKVRENGDIDVKIFDCSKGCGFPVVAARLISKTTHAYIFHYGADPVLEIAIERTLTELFQGRKLADFYTGNKIRTTILNDVNDLDININEFNQLETSNGYYTVDFFTEELNEQEFKGFENNADKNNSQLLASLMNFFKKLGKPVYVRNYSYLGFPTYKFIVPGYSEVRGKILEEVPTFWFAEQTSKALKDLESADMMQLTNMVLYYSMVANLYSRRYNFPRLCGVPLIEINSAFLCEIHLAYAYLRLNNNKEFLKCLLNAKNYIGESNDKDYVECLWQYYTFIINGVDKAKAFSVLEKFYYETSVSRLKEYIKDGKTGIEYFLLKCDKKNCENCNYKENCRYDVVCDIIGKVGEKYKQFTNGQAKKEFAL